MLMAMLSLMVVSERPVITLGLILILAAIILALFRSLQLGLSLFDPAYVSTAAFLLLFLLRPLYDLINDRFYWIHIDVDAVMPTVIVAVVVAVLFFYAGLFSGIGEGIARRLPRPSSAYSDVVLLASAFGFVALAVASRLAWAYYAGGFHILLSRRENIVPTGANIPLFAQATNLVIPAMIIFLYYWPRRLFLSSIGIGLSLFVMFQTVLGGDRRYALTFIVVVIAYLHISGKKTWRLRSMMIMAILGFALFVGPVELTRGGGMGYGQAVVATVQNPFSVIETLFLRSLSTSMVNAFGIVVKEIDDGFVTFRYGLSTMLETVLQPIPRQIWNEKPLPIRSVIIDREWGMEEGRCVSQCPTFSAVSTFYSDLGMVGIALGTFACGILLAVPRGYLHRYPSDFLAHAMMGSIVMVPFMLWWGSLSSLTLGIATNFVPILVVATVAGKVRGRQRRRSRKRGRFARGTLVH